MAVAKQKRQKPASAPATTAPKQRADRAQNKDLRRALEELRDTGSDARAAEVKKAIADIICGG